MSHVSVAGRKDAGAQVWAEAPNGGGALSGGGGAWVRLTVLLGLYFVQGLPFGFQAKALPVFLRLRGASLSAISASHLLSLPWSCKLLAAPFVDVVGTRMTWIVPTQLALALCCLVTAAVMRGVEADPAAPLWPLLALLFAINLCSATQDVAVDGLAVDLLRGNAELSYGNTAQVVGFKVGILFGGGVLLAVSAAHGFAALFVCIAVLVLLVLAAVVAVAPRIAPAQRRRADAAAAATSARRSLCAQLRGVWDALWRSMRRPATRWVLAFAAVYKAGEVMSDTLWKPLLLDAGFSAAQIGLWSGLYGSAASIAGSVVGGALASRSASLLRALMCACSLVSASLALRWAIAVSAGVSAVASAGGAASGAPPRVSEAAVLAAVVTENACGGCVTTITFAWLMAQVDPAIGATHYTLLATVEVAAKSLLAVCSGPIAEAHGYPFAFGLATLLSAAVLLLFVPLSAIPRSQLQLLPLQSDSAAGDGEDVPLTGTAPAHES